MPRILITSGPTRQYLDPVRYLTNASSGRMGCALADAALGLGHEVVIVSGPVEVDYPAGARVVPVVSTEEMLAAAACEFEHCDGLIAAAAPCDYRPERVEDHKIAKTGQPLELHLIETEDVAATLGELQGRPLGRRVRPRNRRPSPPRPGQARTQALRPGHHQQPLGNRLSRQHRRNPRPRRHKSSPPSPAPNKKLPPKSCNSSNAHLIQKRGALEVPLPCREGPGEGSARAANIRRFP